MIEIINISKKFGELTAVDGVSFTVKDKECFSLLGFNGAGKTTLINLLTTCLKPTSGGATINGYDIVKDEQKIKPIINIAPQEIAVAKNLTVKENLELIADLYGVENRDKAIDEIIEEFGLAEKAGVQAKKLSGGQLKRLSIALAVITRPQILFLDEPTLGLDIKSRRNLWELIKKLKSQMTIFLTTHYLEEVENLTDRIAIISKGKIKAIGTVPEILEMTAENSLEEAFLKLSEEEE